MISFNLERVRVVEEGGKHGEYVHYADAMQEIKTRDERIAALEKALEAIADRGASTRRSQVIARAALAVGKE